MMIFDFLRRRFHPLWHLRQMAWFRRFQRHCDFVIYQKRGDLKMAVRCLRDLPYLLPHANEGKESSDLFCRVIRDLPVAVLFDVGANVGVYAWNARSVQPKLRVLLFEPDVVNADLLRRTVRKNQLLDVELFEGAVAEAPGTVSFVTDEASGATGSIVKDGREGSFQQQYGAEGERVVPATNLDAYVQRDLAGHIMVKVDVEGAEEFVLKGARRFVERWRPLFLVESFEIGTLSPLEGVNYGIVSVGASGNHLLFPNEMKAVLIEKGLVSLAAEGLDSVLERARDFASDRRV